MKKPKKHPEFIYMVVSIVAFICTGTAIIVFSRTSGIYTRFSFEVVVTLTFISILLIPAIVKAYAYSNMFKYDRNENNFNASFAINEYKLKGWIKGKYTFLEAMSLACNGSFERAFDLYVECLGKAEDRRLRLACYRDMEKNLKRMNNPIRLIPYIRKGFEEFPNDLILFEHVAQYYIWYKFANEEEALEWFENAVKISGEARIKGRAYYFMGFTEMYNKEYEKAEAHFLEACSMTTPAPSYLMIDMAVCEACLGKFDEARDCALKAIMITEESDNLNYIGEKLDYLFKALTEPVNPDSEKLVEELKRRRDAAMEDSVHVSDIESYNAAVEKAKKRIR